MQAYSVDLRERVLADSEAGMRTKGLAEKYRVSESWVRKMKKQWRETGQVGPRQQRVSHATKLDDHQQQLQRLVDETPDATLQELCDQLPVQVSTATMSRALTRLKLTFKKSIACRRAKAAGCAGAASRVARPDAGSGCAQAGVYR